ncbi:MAG TPA: tyrosine-protein phosphatase [Bryobacteraceae bacterium]|jgi:tyrosine-protein phosphatase SIW14|nr:tyrosine-protein phosphatase [Bryobacteraceae bacterium]
MKYRLFLFFAAAALAAAQVAGVPNFHKVNDGLYRGGQPTEDGFENLASLGVKTVIDLRGIGEHSQAREQGWVQADGMHYLSVPLGQLSAPHDADVAKTLAILNNSTGAPVFIHCRRGADRTGTIIACYRIEHDHWDNRKALKEARGYGMSRLERAMQHYILRFETEAASADAQQ